MVSGLLFQKSFKLTQCAQRGARTPDPEIKSLMLYRLSYPGHTQFPIHFQYKSGDIHVLVPIKTPQTTIIFDSERERNCNSWKTLALHRGCSEEHWCASIEFDLNIILGCAQSRFSWFFRVSLQRPIFGHLWLAHFLDDPPVSPN